MNVTEIIQQALSDGVTVAADGAGTLKLVGEQAMVDRWLPTIRENKIDILAALVPRRDSASPPTVCQVCTRLEVVKILSRPVPGCLYTATGEYTDGWKRLSVNLMKCLWN